MQKTLVRRTLGDTAAMITMEMGCDKVKMSCLSWTLFGVADTKCHIQFF